MDSSTKTSRPRLVVLGSGWGAMSFIKSLPANISEMYEVVVVSPRNYFLYTPLLPAVATGTMEERSIVEPVRNFIIGKEGGRGRRLLCSCSRACPLRRCCFPAAAAAATAAAAAAVATAAAAAVGSVNNTFGIRGVDQYCFYFKSIEDAGRLRARVSECFERAALPATPEEERKKLLTFVVVGGGPTGVEVAAELYDMIECDLSKLYPNIVSIQIVELMDHVLSTYDRAISIYTAEQFKRAGIKLVLNSRVAAVEDGCVRVVNKANEVTEIKFGACVWATGIAMNPLIRQLQEKLPGQSHFRSVLTDECLRVKGSDGSIWALGDAATIDQPKVSGWVANQQGKYLAKVFSSTKITGNPEGGGLRVRVRARARARGGWYFHKGSAAYVGSDKAVFDLPRLGPLTGTGAGFVWKSYETMSQFSFRNQCLVAADWLRTKIFGRDISRV
ncbi:hypothetical protein VOLCADRAFT_76599 [Volvox carteri f. nagariensis]|uniref:NADH:ubiquinone reductase (non-electrogenic) n=1 Tax=Volvox carteri f. nagariensis TaxID=3068 RepID=D8U989_VOLCA|nr:uncharacterized protein VOLCADRAFT_76599 [Volvox carteri f. nagariensis]EFJ43711.1 hypothetical protein VOLCADRAFT_76599 [Volvox carteri f. nagariensis]|eukprot:XP_002955192.1 hypothetical protein VOLCADRAFT_76599 [Volvox carteri f. nagariensis]